MGIDKPLRRRIVDAALDTTIGPRFIGSEFPQSIWSGLIPICLGYVLVTYVSLSFCFRYEGTHVRIIREVNPGR